MDSRIDRVCEIIRAPIQKREISWNKLTPEKLGFDIWELARRTKAAVVSSAKVCNKDRMGRPIYSVKCPFKEMKKKHADFLASVIAMSPYAYGGVQFIVDKGVPFLNKEFGVELILPDEYGMAIDESVLAVWFAGVPLLSKEISADPNWFRDKQNRIFISACVYLVLRSFLFLESTTIRPICDKALVELSRKSMAKNLPAFIPEADDCALAPELYDSLLDFCAFVYPSLYASASQLEEVKRELSLQATENEKLSSKASKLEKSLSETNAILKIRTEEANNKIRFLEDKVNAQNKAIVKLEREKKDEIDALQAKLDQANTEAEMLMKFIQQSDELESVSTEVKVEQGIRNDLDLENMKVLVVGGHENFLNKLRQRFPKWSIPGEELFTSEPTKVDVVIYIPLHCGHSLYAKGKTVAASTDAYELYTQSVNIEAFINEVTENLWKLLMRKSSD